MTISEIRKEIVSYRYKGWSFYVDEIGSQFLFTVLNETRSRSVYVPVDHVNDTATVRKICEELAKRCT